MKRLDILYCISHGFALRMVLQTKLLNKLSAKGLNVGIIGPEISSDKLFDIDIANNIKLIEFNPKSGFGIGQFQMLRNYILEDVKGNTALWDKHLERKRKSKGNIKEKLKSAIYMIVFYVVKAFPFLKSIYIKLEKKLLHSIEAIQVLREHQPRMVVSTYPVNWVEAMLIQNANNLGIDTTIHLLSWDNISCKGRFPALAKNYLAWGPIMKDEFVEYYKIAPENIKITGVPHFDLHYHTLTNSVESTFNQGNPYIFFAMSSPRFAPNEIDIVEWLADQVNNGVLGVNINLVVRPHPQNVTGSMADLSWLDRLRNINHGRVKIDFPSLSTGKLAWGMHQNDMPHMSQVLHGALVCLNSGSTMSIDALLVETPVIITSFDGDEQLPYWSSARRLIDFPHLKKFISIGKIPTANNYKDLKNAVLEIIENKGKLSNEMRLVVEQECGTLIGKSTTAVVNSFCELDNKSYSISIT